MIISTPFGFLGLGDTTGAIDAFEQATDEKELWPARLPISDPLSRDHHRPTGDEAVDERNLADKSAEKLLGRR